MSDSFYRFGQLLGAPLRLLFDLRISGLERIPRGPCLLAANHISHADPPLIGILTPRPIDYMAAAEFFVHPLSRRLLTGLNAFPIDRARRDLSAVKVAATRLKKGRLVGIFVEGGIRHGARSVLNGASVGEGFTALAQAQGVPVLPAVILGSDQLYQWRAWLRRPRIFIRYGVPFTPGPEEERGALALRLCASLRDLAAEMRRDYGVRDEEMPVSAQERWAERP